MAGLWIELFIGLVKVFATKLLSNKGTTFQASLSVLHYQEWSKLDLDKQLAYCEWKVYSHFRLSHFEPALLTFKLQAC